MGLFQKNFIVEYRVGEQTLIKTLKAFNRAAAKYKLLLQVEGARVISVHQIKK